MFFGGFCLFVCFLSAYIEPINDLNYLLLILQFYNINRIKQRIEEYFPWGHWVNPRVLKGFYGTQSYVYL